MRLSLFPLVASAALASAAPAGTPVSTPGHASVAVPQSAPLPPARLDSIARRIVAAARYATFVTVDAAGRPQARTVQPRLPGAGWDVWFATNPRTRKVAEVARRATVAVHYFDPATESYVAITGRARVVRDPAVMARQWDPAWNAFYPDRDKGVVLIAIEADRIEVVSPRLGVDSDPVTWRPQAFVPRAPSVSPPRSSPPSRPMPPAAAPAP